MSARSFAAFVIVIREKIGLQCAFKTSERILKLKKHIASDQNYGCERGGAFTPIAVKRDDRDNFNKYILYGFQGSR